MIGKEQREEPTSLSGGEQKAGFPLAVVSQLRVNRMLALPGMLKCAGVRRSAGHGEV